MASIYYLLTTQTKFTHTQVKYRKLKGMGQTWPNIQNDCVLNTHRYKVKNNSSAQWIILFNQFSKHLPSGHCATMEGPLF